MTLKTLRNRVLICFFSLLPFHEFLSAQNNILPKIGASPEVAMLGKFDYAPVNIYNGVPDISIPLYTIKENGQEIPVVLRYNSSGIKVSEEATWVGLGWNLSVGGYITWIPVGQPDQDDHVTTYSNWNNLIGMVPDINSYRVRKEDGILFDCPLLGTPASSDDLALFKYIAQYGTGQPDMYSFALPSTSGQFYYNPNNKKYCMRGNKTEQVFIKKDAVANQWCLMDMNGNQYIFKNQDMEKTINNYGIPNRLSDLYTESKTWHLSTIKNTNGDSITFQYQDGKVTSTGLTESYTDNLYHNATPSQSKDVTSETSYIKYLNGIESSNQRVEFVLSSSADERQDLSGGNTNGVYSAKRLNYIHVWDKVSNKKILSYRFIYDYFNNTSTTPLEYKRLKLVSIVKIGYNNGVKSDSLNFCNFEYNETPSLPGKHSYAMDYWGYYNGQIHNTGLLPRLSENALSGISRITSLPTSVISDIVSHGDANRGVDSSYVSSGILKKITYYTGGYSLLRYQSNDFTNYSVLSAKDIDQGGTGIRNVSFYDIKCCQNPLPKASNIILPDNKGMLSLVDLSFIVSKMSSSLSYSYFLSAYARIMRIDSNNNAVQIVNWTIPSDQINSFAASGIYQINIPYYNFQGNVGDKYYAEVSLGSNMPCGNSTFPQDRIASFQFSYIDTTLYTRKAVSYGGGLRIAAEEMRDKNSKLLQKKIFKYVSNNNNSSGKLMSPLRFYSFQPIVNTWTIGSTAVGIDLNAYLFSISMNSYTPLSYDANGALVGYDRVITSEIDSTNNTNGESILYYNNTPATVLNVSARDVPDIPHVENGLVKRTDYLDKSLKIIKREWYDYWSIQDSICVAAAIYDNYIGIDNCSGFNYQYHGRWDVYTYPVGTRWFKMAKKTDVLYSTYDSITNIYQYTYNTLGQLTNELQTLDSGNKNEKKYQYLTEIGDAYSICAAMRNKNLYNSLFDEKMVKNGSQLVDETKYTFNNCPSGNIKPSVVQKISSTDSYNSIDNIMYDIKDNMISYKPYNQPNAVILWSYNYQYPVAKIEGLTYAQVLTYYSQTSINNLANTANPTIDQINAIRTALASQPALVTTYTYAPLIGMTTATNPQGVTTNYMYDAFARLWRVRNDDKNLLAQYRYGYQGALDNGMGGYTAPSAVISTNASSYNLGATGTATLSVSGGSGSYSYSWILKNNSGTTLQSSTSGSSFSYTCSQTGTLTVQCQVVDNQTGQTTTGSTNITCNAIVVTGNFTIINGFHNAYNTLSSDGSVVSFVLSFATPIQMNTNTIYYVATVNQSFRPSADRTITYTTGGRTWNITFFTNGYVGCTIISGSYLPLNNGMGISSTYNL